MTALDSPPGPAHSRAEEREKLTMVRALNRALDEAMAADDRVLMFGEDVGPLGGVFRVTDGLTARYGGGRCFDTPLAASGIGGVAVGLAMKRVRPVQHRQGAALASHAATRTVGT